MVHKDMTHKITDGREQEEEEVGWGWDPEERGNCIRGGGRKKHQ